MTVPIQKTCHSNANFNGTTKWPYQRVFACTNSEYIIFPDVQISRCRNTPKDRLDRYEWVNSEFILFYAPFVHLLLWLHILYSILSLSWSRHIWYIPFPFSFRLSRFICRANLSSEPVLRNRFSFAFHFCSFSLIYFRFLCVCQAKWIVREE